MKQEAKTVEEVKAIVDPLMAENKWAIAVVEKEDGSFTIQWMEHKTYTSHDGEEFKDEVWTTREGDMKLVQDLEPEHLRNILRMMLRNERMSKENMRTLFEQMAESMLGDDEEEESLFPNWEPTESKSHLH